MDSVSGINGLETAPTSSDSVDSTQFSNAESDKKFGWMKRSMT